jgi:broad specificity phosphatase PhoE
MIASSLLYGLLAAASTVQAASHPKSIKYEVVTGLFQQDDNATDPSTFNFIASNFGLINRTYPSDKSCKRCTTQWQRLTHYIDTLNDKAKKSERYSLFFMGRHGEGYHNAAESYLGTPAWNCFWSEKDGNGTVTWADAELTDVGVTQAKAVNTFWQHLITDEKIVTPQAFYTSPLYRCLDTARITFDGLSLKPKFKPVVKKFKGFKFEKGFAEEDPYWTELHAEPRQDQDNRSKAVLDDIFTNDDSTYISITSHSGETASLLRGKWTSNVKN